MICEAAERQGTPMQEDDIVVVTQKVVSKVEGRVVRLKDVKPSDFAISLSKRVKKEPSLVELILREAKNIVRMGDGHLITETRHGWVCANSAIDKSNVSGGDSVALLPANPDRSARRLRQRVRELTGKRVAVIISDTFGRPLRMGHVDVAIGVAGINPILDLRGGRDIFGYVMRVKQAAIADELASAAELVIGNVGEMIPAAIVRGYRYPVDESAKARALIRPRSEDLFI